MTVQLAGAQNREAVVGELAALQTRAELLLRALSLVLPGSRTIRQLGAHLDRRFDRGVLRLALGFPGGSWNWRGLWSIRGHRAGLWLCLRNDCCETQLAVKKA